MKVIGYVRVSTSGQAKNGYRLPYQQGEIRLWRSAPVKILDHREFKKYGVDVRSIEQQTYSNLFEHKESNPDWSLSQLAYQMIDDGFEADGLHQAVV